MQAPSNAIVTAVSGSFDALKVFSATKHQEREKLGETITEWIRSNVHDPKSRNFGAVVATVVTQSSDSEFHCLTVTLFYKLAKP